MTKRLLFACLTLLSVACATTTQSLPPLTPPVRVLIIGDSISMGYTKIVQEALGDRFVTTRPLNKKGKPLNCEGTTRGVQRIDEWLAADGGQWDVVHFNFGLHDLKHVNAETGKNSNDPEDPHQAPIPKYKEQLRTIIESLQASGARLVFATTTPVPDGDLRPLRSAGDSRDYNEAALAVLADIDGGEDIVVNDLWSFIEVRPELKRVGNVHFSKEGSALLGAEVARVIAGVAGLPLPESSSSAE